MIRRSSRIRKASEKLTNKRRTSLVEDDAADVVVYEDSDDDYIPSDSDSSEAEEEGETRVRAIPQTCELPFSPLYRPPILPFTAKEGLNIEVQDSDNVMSFVNLFFTDEFFQHIVDQTNLYATQAISAAPRPFTKFSLYQNWVPVTVAEIKKFLGLTFITGIIKKPTLKMYWADDPVFGTPIFSKTMPRHRFEAILAFLHFNDSSLQKDDSSALYKIQPIVEMLCDRFSHLYTPSQQLALDEGMLAWRGRLRFRVYNPGKIVKYGIMVRMVCESSSGYICKLLIYDGSGMKLDETVLHLLQPYLHKGYQVYMDNYYNSMKLSKDLHAKQTSTCGTIRQNRGLPKEFKQQSSSLQRGEMTFTREEPVLLTAWRDKRVINMISTIHSADMKEVVNRYGCKKMKPECIVDYNKYMHGVDNADQYLALYPFIRKTVKWPKKLFFHILQCTLFNSFVLFCKSNPSKKLTFLQYMQVVSRQFVQQDDITEVPQSPASTSSSLSCSSAVVTPPRRAPAKDPPYRLDGKRKEHVLLHFPATKSDRTPTRRCRVCMKNSKVSETRWFCKKCGVPLHPGLCDTRYHTLKQY